MKTKNNEKYDSRRAGKDEARSQRKTERSQATSIKEGASRAGSKTCITRTGSVNLNLAPLIWCHLTMFAEFYNIHVNDAIARVISEGIDLVDWLNERHAR